MLENYALMENVDISTNTTNSVVELDETSKENLLAERARFQKNKNRAFWLAVCSAAGALGTGIFSVYKVFSIAYDPGPEPGEDFSSVKNINITVGTGCGSLGLFGLCKYARYKINKNQEDIDRINSELSRLNLKAG